MKFRAAVACKATGGRLVAMNNRIENAAHNAQMKEDL